MKYSHEPWIITAYIDIAQRSLTIVIFYKRTTQVFLNIRSIIFTSFILTYINHRTMNHLKKKRGNDSPMDGNVSSRWSSNSMASAKSWQLDTTRGALLAVSRLSARWFHSESRGFKEILPVSIIEHNYIYYIYPFIRFCNWSGVSRNGFLGLSKYFIYGGNELYCRYLIISPMR